MAGSVSAIGVVTMTSAPMPQSAHTHQGRPQKNRITRCTPPSMDAVARFR